MSEELVKVHDVSQEYWYIGRIRCTCGGKFQKEMQGLEERSGKRVDCVTTRCNTCGASREFLFDISAFRESLADITNIIEFSQAVADERLRTKIRKAAGSPVAAAVQAILTAGESKDVLALDWLEDAIRHARTKLGANS